MSARESKLLALIYRRSRAVERMPGIVVGPGDDTAVVDLGAGTLIGVDQLIEGSHFERDRASIDQIARKAIARSLSDLAAMGGQPTCALAAAALPSGFDHADDLFDRMAHWALHWGCPLVGGDIARIDGPLTIGVTAVGRSHPARGSVLRSQARAGDDLWVTGALGGAVASGRHLEFEPRLAESQRLCASLGDALGAMIDLSDGLGRDGARLGAASGIRLEIDLAAIPIHESAEDWRQAVAEGEDYELLFSTRADASIPDLGIPCTRIGSIIEGEGCAGRGPDGAPIDLTEMGWDHTT